MNQEYRIWFNIVFRHEFWNVSEPRLFEIYPTEASTELGRKFNIIFKPGHNGLEVLAPVEFITNSRLKPQMTFKVLCIDPFLKNYTQVEAITDTHVLHVQLPGDKQNDFVKLPIVRSLSTLFQRGLITKLINSRGVDMVSEITGGIANPHFAHIIDQSEEQYYTTDSDIVPEIIYEHQLTKKLFAWLTVDTTAVTGQEIKAQLTSREVHLVYKIKSDQYNLKELQLNDPADVVRFTSKTSGDMAVFSSAKKTKWKQQPEHAFQLMNGKSKPIREGLGSSGHRNLKYNDINEPYLEIFIHL